MGKIVQLIQTLLMLMMMRRRLEREDATSVNVYITLEDDAFYHLGQIQKMESQDIRQLKFEEPFA